jgi:hypothetical protein
MANNREIILANLQGLKEQGASSEEAKQYLLSVGDHVSYMPAYYEFIDDIYRTEEPTFLEQVGRGATDVQLGAQRGLGMMTPDEIAQATADEELYSRNVGEGFDYGRLAGQTGATLALGTPAMAARTGWGLRGLLGAVPAAAAGYSIWQPTQDQQIDAAAVSGAIGGGLSLISPLLGSLARGGAQWLNQLTNRRGNKIQEMVDDGLLTDATSPYETLQDSASGAGRRITENIAERTAGLLRDGREIDEEDVQAVARAEMSKHYGYEGDAAITRGQATQDPALIKEEVELAKRIGGEQLADRFDEQAAVPLKVVTDIVEPYADLGDARTMSKKVAQAIDDEADRLQKEVTDAYDAIPPGNFAPERVESFFKGTLTALEDSIPPQVKRRIKELADSKSERPKTIAELMKLHRLITRAMPRGTEAAKNNAARDLKMDFARMIDDVAEQQVAPEIARAIKNANDLASTRFRKLQEGKKGGAIDQIRSGNVKSDALPGVISRADSEELAAMKELIGDEFNNVRGIFLDPLKIVLDETTGAKKYTHQWFRQQLSSMGTEKIKTVFPEDQANNLLDFDKVSRAIHTTDPIGRRDTNINRSNTSSTLMSSLQTDDLIDMLGGPIMRTVRRVAGPGAKVQAARDRTRSLLDDQPQVDPLQASLLSAITPRLESMRQQSNIPGLGLGEFANIYDIGRGSIVPASGIISGESAAREPRLLR